MSKTSKAMAEVVKAALAAEGFAADDVIVTATYRSGGLWTLYLDDTDTARLNRAWKVARAAIFAAVEGIRIAPAKTRGHAMWHLRREYSGAASGVLRMGLMWRADAETAVRMDEAMRLGTGMRAA